MNVNVALCRTNSSQLLTSAKPQQSLLPSGEGARRADEGALPHVITNPPKLRTKFQIVKNSA